VSVQKSNVAHGELPAGDRAVMPPPCLLPQDGSLQAPRPDGEALARRRCQSHAWTRAMGEVGRYGDTRVPRV